MIAPAPLGWRWAEPGLGVDDAVTWAIADGGQFGSIFFSARDPERRYGALSLYVELRYDPGAGLSVAVADGRVVVERDADRAGLARSAHVQLVAMGVAVEYADLRRLMDEFVSNLPAEYAQAVETRADAALPAPVAHLLSKEFPEVIEIIPGVLPGGVVLLIGKPKTGKSLLALSLAVSVACDGRALGTIPVDPGAVLVLSLEDGERRLQGRLRGLLDGVPTPEGFDYATTWLTIDEGGVEALDAWCAAHPGCRLIVIDTLKRIRPKGSPRGKSAYDIDYESVAPLGELPHRYPGLAIVVVHHSRKASADDAGDLASGTLGLTGGVNGTIVLQRGRGQADATLTIIHRDIPERELALRFDPAIGWRLLGDAAELRRSTERTEMLAVLQTRGAVDAETAVALKDLHGARTGKPSYDSTKKLLARMAADGLVRATGHGRYYAIYTHSQSPEYLKGLESLESPESPSEGEKGTKGLKGQGTLGSQNGAHDDPDGDFADWPLAATIRELWPDARLERIS